ncbi:hypothetical protein BURKHO8Y_20126 [Burkholderia sp. 8Y]|nr:hypothetical protein BURKHO8Y_20126 [Burkholderia sp. 8Y]
MSAGRFKSSGTVSDATTTGRDCAEALLNRVRALLIGGLVAMAVHGRPWFCQAFTTR